MKLVWIAVLSGLLASTAAASPRVRKPGTCPAMRPPGSEVRPSSLAPMASGCQPGERADHTVTETMHPFGAGDGPQTGDQRCHRVCDDNICAPGERCEERPVFVDDTGSRTINLCVCDSARCKKGIPGRVSAPEGGLVSWRPEPALPARLSGHAMAVAGDRLLVSGGRVGSAGKLSDAIFSATVDRDGRLSAWQPAGKLPAPLGDHAMVVAGSRLFVAGGKRDGVLQKAVFSARMDAGTLGPWREEASLPGPRAGHALLKAGPMLVVAGGIVDAQGHATSELWLANANGLTALSWQVLSAPFKLPVGAGAGVVRDRIYAFDPVSAELQSASVVALQPDQGPSWRSEGKLELPAGAARRSLHIRAVCKALVLVSVSGMVVTGDLGSEGQIGIWRQAVRVEGLRRGFASAEAMDTIYLSGGGGAKVLSTTRQGRR